MNIHGFITLTLLDYPEHLAASVFLGSCNLRCPFCQNGNLVLSPENEPSISEEEVLAFLKKRSGILEGVCISGGEPTLYRELPDFISKIKALGYLVKLDTNGTNPEMLRFLYENHLLDYIAMDIKNSPERYGETAGVPGLDLGPIRESVSWLLEGHVDYEFRTTVVRQFHDSASFRAIGPWISGARRYFLQAFIDRDTVLRPGLSAWSREEMEGFAALVRPWVPAVELRGI